MTHSYLFLHAFFGFSGIKLSAVMELIGIFIITTLVAAQCVSCRKGIVQEVFMNKKILCSSLSKVVYTAASEMQCVHRCLKHENCGVLNFKETTSTNHLKDNCEVYSLLLTNSTCSTLADQTGWKAMIFKVIWMIQILA